MQRQIHSLPAVRDSAACNFISVLKVPDPAWRDMVKSVNVLVSVSLIASFVALFFAIFSYVQNRRLPADAQIGEYRLVGAINTTTRETLTFPPFDNKKNDGWLVLPPGNWRLIFDVRFDDKGNFYNTIPGVFLFALQTLTDVRNAQGDQDTLVDAVFPIVSQVNYLNDTTSFLPTRGPGTYTNITALRSGDNIHFDVVLPSDVAFARTCSMQVLKIT